MRRVIKFLTFFVFAVWAQNINAQVPQFSWAASAGGYNYDYLSGMKFDLSGNIVLAGSFYDSVYFGSQKLTGDGYSDIFIAKYDSKGNVISAIKTGNAGYESAAGLTIDNSDNIIISGDYTSPPQLYDHFIFVNKYYSGGALQWQQVGRGGSMTSGNVTSDNMGGIIVTGFFSDSVTFGNYTLYATGSYDAYIVKYNSLGEIQWAKSIGAPGYQHFNSDISTIGTDILFCATQNYYVGNYPITGFFFSKYDAGGNLLWQKDANVTGTAAVNRIVSDVSGNIYLAGTFDSVMVIDNQTFTTSGRKFFAAKFNSGGSYQWLHYMNYFNSDMIADIKADQAGNLYVIGDAVFSETNTMFMQKYSRDGTLLWEHLYDQNSSGTALAIDNNGQVAAAGTFSAQLNLGTNVLNPLGSTDIFIGRIPAPVLPFPVQAIDFGIAALGKTINQVYELTNNTSAPLYLLSFNLTGSNNFTIVSGAEPGFLLPGLTRTVGISFTPSAAGTINGSLTIVTDAANGDEILGLFGTGEILSIQLSADTLDFGSVLLSQSTSIDVTLYNKSQLGINILNTGITGDAENNFVNDNPGQLTSIAPMDSGKITIRFSPQTKGDKTGILFIQSEAQGSPQQVYLKGRGTLAADTIRFGEVSIPDTLLYMMSVRNGGSIDLSISGLTIGGINAADFSLGVTAPLTPVPPMDSTVIPVYFHPKTEGNKYSYVVITSNAPGSPDTINMTGTAISALQVSITSEDLSKGITVSVQPPAGFNFSSNYLFYRRSGQPGYFSVPFSGTQNTFTALIPPEFIGLRGVQYYAEFSDLRTTITYPSMNAYEMPAFVQIKYPEIPFPDTLRADKYHMVSIPVLLDDKTFSGQLNDNYGPYNPAKYRLLRWMSADSIYAELSSEQEKIEPGKGFWMINSDGSSFNLANGQAVTPITPFEIPLAPGWNQIGNPFSYPVWWSNFPELTTPAIMWDPDSAAYIDNQYMLQPWKGYWVYSGSTDTTYAYIYPEEAVIVYGTAENKINTREYLVSVKASINSLGIHDSKNFVGTTDTSPEQLQKKNTYKPPAVVKGFDLGIILENKRFMRNYKEYSDDGDYWDFSIRSDYKNETAELKLERIAGIPDEFRIWIIDITHNKALSVYKDLASIKLSDKGETFFRIIIGTEKFAAENANGVSLTPSDFMVYQNFPNPFNPLTTIAFSTPAAGNIQVKIFDILGREISTIVNEQMEAGIHEVKLDMQNEASGVYFYTVEFNQTRISKKLVLMK